MPQPEIPAEAPPSYQDATGSSSSSRPAATSKNPSSATAGKSHLSVPGGEDHDDDGIPSSYRRSMEDENRPLPKGWVRSFDPTNHHQFFVDTTKDPPRSVWVHPYDDEEYLSSLSSDDRERIEQESMNRGHPPSKADIMAAHTDDEDEGHPPIGELPPRPDKGKGKDGRSFGRKFKDKVTGSTHEEREADRKRRAEEERKLYQQHLAFRRAMGEAARTGKPQLVGKDSDGKDIYVEPPAPPSGPYGYGGGGYPGNGYGRGGYGVDPYRGGVYSTPDARYIRPPNPYSRPQGYGYGGGYGLPLGIGGGLLGGLLIGDALGGFGGGFGGGGL